MTALTAARDFWHGVFAVAYREATVLRHDRAFLITVVMQPVVMLLLFGVLKNEPANVPWAVFDRSATTASRRFVQDLLATGYFLPPVAVASYDEGRSLLTHGRALALLVVPETFRRDQAARDASVQLLLDGSDPLAAARIGAYVAQVAAGQGPVAARHRFWFNPTLSDQAFFLAVIAGMLLTNLCLSATANSIVGERERGTYEQILALPTTNLQIVLGKVAPLVVISYGVVVGVLIAAGLLFGLWPQGSWLAILVVSLPFILASLAVGVVVSILSETSEQSIFISVFFIMPSFQLSGVLLPYALMPPEVRAVGAVLPLRWYQMALRSIVSRGGGLGDVLVPFAVLTAQLAVLLFVARWRLKPRLG
jgi:ABC-2 type transport system permease protein